MELNEVVVKVDRSKMENGQDQSTADVTSEKQHEMKTSKGHILTKYVVLYSFILVTVVLSTIIANHVSTKSLMDSIPNQINQNIWTIPEWSILENLSSIQAEIKHALQIDIKNETKSASELVLQRFLNETDFISWKKDMNRKIFTMIHLLVCVNNCTGRPDGDYQSCYTCNGFVSCSLGILSNRTCAFSDDDKMVLWDNIKKRCGYSSDTCNPDYLLV
ncbi:uncharacterized protein LOC128171107 [Crassostrea angulata]|uniref:uncharacterized protein LOC128171107 n=1 Tax=Magallana angulata TaxID=2784310 RepID=UPI0022B1090A|nr:uncharacterized protein LOC128171107 [Crassostrea angulata]